MYVQTEDQVPHFSTAQRRNDQLTSISNRTKLAKDCRIKQDIMGVEAPDSVLLYLLQWSTPFSLLIVERCRRTDFLRLERKPLP
jgi:hypothetical protein